MAHYHNDKFKKMAEDTLEIFDNDEFDEDMYECLESTCLYKPGYDFSKFIGDINPILLEREHKTEKGALALCYPNAMSGIKVLKGEDIDNTIKRINNVQVYWKKEIKDKYNI